MEVIGIRRAQFLARERLFVNIQKIRNALRRNILEDRHAVPAGDADVVPALGFHLSQYVVFRGVQINALSVPRQTIIVFGLPEPGHKTGHPLPPGIDAQMAHHSLLVLPLPLDEL